MNQLLILDTGPLWELVLYRCIDQLRFESLKPDLTHLRERHHYNSLTQFVGSFRRRTTTPGVVAEISRRIRNTPKQGHPQFWRLVRTEFFQMRMDEELIKLLDMPLDLVAAFGAVDASVLKLGLLHSASHPCILTGDEALLRECQNHRLHAIHIREVVL